MRCGLQKKFPPELSSRVVCCIILLNLWDMFNWRPCISAVLLQYESLQKENEKIKKEVRLFTVMLSFLSPFISFFLALLRSVCGLKGIVHPKIKENILEKYKYLTALHWFSLYWHTTFCILSSLLTFMYTTIQKFEVCKIFVRRLLFKKDVFI